ncbi:MAG: hypothetical protein ACOYM7_07820 [Paludibacter sp.]
MILFFCFVSLGIMAQEKPVTSKVTLKTGTVYVGEIVLKNDEVVMLKDNTGARYQFQPSEIVQIEPYVVANTENSSPQTTTIPDAHINDNFCGRFEFASTTGSLQRGAEDQPLTQFLLSFGNKKVLGKDIFVGLGSGFLIMNNTNVNLIPIYLKVQTITNKNRTSPFWGVESGYTFSINNYYKGGAFAAVSAGTNYKVNYKTSIYAGIFGAVYSINGTFTESITQGIYAYNGNATLKTYGLKLGLQF